jgi:hypothetical protein
MMLQILIEKYDYKQAKKANNNFDLTQIFNFNLAFPFEPEPKK